jgi:hypothetical protein
VWLVVVRLGAVFAALLLVALAVRYRRRAIEVLREFWLTPTSPLNLAALRIVIFYALWRSALGQNFVFYAGMPAAERALPFGWEWVGPWAFDERVISSASSAFALASLAALLGIATPVTAPVAALLAVYLLGLPNSFAKINHGHHARVLCALVIAAAPSGDALSFDRLWQRLRGRAPPEPSIAYTLPVRFAWVLIGTTYFFPGVWKLWKSGDQWFSGEALKFHLYSSWATRPDFEPIFPIDRHEWLLAPLGSATLLFEIGFLFALLHRATRVLAALSAVGFHLGVAHTMGIRFPAFFPLVVLLELPESWRALRRHFPPGLLAFGASARARLEAGLDMLRRRGGSPAPRSLVSRTIAPAVVAGTLLVFGQSLTGAIGLSTWPVSVYPTFSGRVRSPPFEGSALRLSLRSGKKTIDLERRFKRFGHARRKALLRDLQRDMSRGPAKNRGGSLVSFLRHSGVRIEPGDRIIVREIRWKVLPPGQRRNEREKVLDRYVVTALGSLERER